ncbi:MAG: hypothetical protein GY864_09535 [Desulfobacterales bacterium]|nr:hypothetical protein [Desulfobacterales bacterium]
MKQTISYSNWKEEYKSFLKKLPDKDIHMLYSGGKDSSLAMDFLSRASKEFEFDFKVHAGAFPVHRYTNREKERLTSYWKTRGIDIIWHDIGQTDEYIRNTPNPCLPCQDLRKNLLHTILKDIVDDWKRLVLITGYSLWDITSYAFEHVLTDIFTGSSKEMGTKKSKRFIETAQRFFPILTMKEGYTMFRPVIKYNSNDILTLIEQEKIPILEIPCEFKGFRSKRFFGGYYEKMGLRFEYDSVLNFAKTSLDLPDISSYTDMNKEKYLTDIF